MDVRREVVVGLFDSADRAREALGELKEAGFAGPTISLLMPAPASAGVLGALTSWLVGIRALAVPGVGLFITAGTIATALDGAAIAAGIGAIADALRGLGIPRDEANFYEEEVRRGNTLVAVRSLDRADQAAIIL